MTTKLARREVTLRLAKNLELPIDVVTQTIAVLAKRRAGKSYFARRFVEQLHNVNQQVCIVDPKGDWWGILSSSDGKSPGLPFVIIGGERGHVPLEPAGGAVVAQLVVEERVSVLLDVSVLRKGELAQFMAVFLEELYRRKATEKYRTPMMLVLDEADAIAPQKPMPNEARMVGAANDIVRRGGQRGIGCAMITQRSAVLSKDVLTQAQMIVGLRTISPQDLSAINAWIDVHGTPTERKTLMESLPSLPVGDAWVWSPGWPTDSGIFRRMHTLPIETFDSHATPKPGERRIEPKRLAEVDLDAVRKQMADTIERHKQDNPKLLRKRIAELELELKRKVPPRAELKIERVEVPVPVLSEGARTTLTDFVRGSERITQDIRKALELLSPTGKKTSPVRGAATTKPARALEAVAQRAAATQRATPGSTRAKVGASADPERAEVGTGGLRRILIALAQRPSGLSARQIGVRAGLSSRSGTFRNYVSRARTHGWSEGSSDAMRITPAGRDALGSFQPLPRGAALLEHWLAELGSGGASRLLSAVAAAYPNTITAEDAAMTAGLAANSGTFRNYVSRLRTLELVHGRGELKASDELFD